MNEQLKRAADAVFAYPDACERRHDPTGYANYPSFKPWLRDEFYFRCVYCLCRERWEANGHHGFSADHIQPRAIRPELASDYDNLLYACVTCNSARQDNQLPVEPSRESLNKHLQMTCDGSIEPLTDQGAQLIEICQLNRAALVGFRRRLQAAISTLVPMNSIEAEAILLDIVAFPDDLPNLAALRPPGGNRRPRGVRLCCHEQRERGELAAFY